MHDVFDDSFDNILFTCALVSYSMHNINLEVELKPRCVCRHNDAYTSIMLCTHF